MFSYARTRQINGHVAYRASDGVWYVIDWSTGLYVGQSFDTRQAAVRYMADAPASGK